jgi:hypothetical protein
MMNRLLSVVIGAALMLFSAAGASAQIGSSYDGQVRTVTVYNTSGFTIEYVYAVPASWYRPDYDIVSGDFIAGRLIYPGQTTVINFDRGDGSCVLDIKFLDTQRGDWIFRNFDVCRGGTLTLRN